MGTDFKHDQQYKVFQVAYQVGVFISRSSGSYIHIEKIWVLSLLQVSNIYYHILSTLLPSKALAVILTMRTPLLKVSEE